MTFLHSHDDVLKRKTSFNDYDDSNTAYIYGIELCEMKKALWQCWNLF